jgi:hypothetical protein
LQKDCSKSGKISFPVYNDKGEIEIMVIDQDDPNLNASDPRLYDTKDRIT